MTSFQLLSSVVFAGLIVAAYGKDIYATLKTWLAKVPRPAVVVPTPPTPAPSNNVKEVVDDLVTVAALRDRFAADGCTEGVDACSLLLKIIIDYKHPHAG